MYTKDNITQELNDMGSILADMSRAMPYSVPAGYFEHFEGSVSMSIHDLNEADITPHWGKALPYTTPTGYFETLPDNIVEKVSVPAHERSVIPLQVPVGYFDALPAKMLQAAKAADMKVSQLSRRISFVYIKWMAAAIFVLGIGISSYHIFFNMQRSAGTDKILSSVPNNEIQDYLQHIYHMDLEKVVNSNPVNNMNLENKDIIQYLNETGWD
jgi:hypothetical protein